MTRGTDVLLGFSTVVRMTDGTSYGIVPFMIPVPLIPFKLSTGYSMISTGHFKTNSRFKIFAGYFRLLLDLACHPTISTGYFKISTGGCMLGMMRATDLHTAGKHTLDCGHGDVCIKRARAQIYVHSAPYGCPDKSCDGHRYASIPFANGMIKAGMSCQLIHCTHEEHDKLSEVCKGFTRVGS